MRASTLVFMLNTLPCRQPLFSITTSSFPTTTFFTTNHPLYTCHTIFPFFIFGRLTGFRRLSNPFHFRLPAHTLPTGE